MGKNLRLVIVGGVAGGASAATRARRLSEDAEIIVIERGNDVSFANCGLPYHIGGVIQDRQRLLVQTPASLHAMYRLDVRTRAEAVSIDRERKTVVVKNLGTGAEEKISYDKRILSPGAEPVRLPIPGIETQGVHCLRSMADMDAIIAGLAFVDEKSALVVGGGYIGLEMAEALRERGVAVTLVELAPQVFGPMDAEMTTPIIGQLELHGVNVRLETSITSIEKTGETISARLSSGETVECGMIIMAVGVKPEIKLAKDAGLTIGERGGIAVDEHMQTSDPDIYAVGDAVEVTDFVGDYQTLIPLAGPANRQGRIAADNILGKASTYKKTQGTSICKVFDIAAGMTGVSEKTLKRLSRHYSKVYIHPASHASYYPGASPISLKLLFDPTDGKVLGAQAVGADGVDKRLDVLATAIRAGLTVFDLEELELSYAPPFGSAKDPVNYAGFVAANALRGDVELCQVEDVLAPADGQVLLDVRRPEEVAAGTIPGAVNIPVQELRERIGELPRDKELLVFCQVGLRGYVACRLLSQLGYKCRNLTGGYKTYTMHTSAIAHKSLVEVGDTQMVDDSGSTGSSFGASDEKPAPEASQPVRLIDACGLQCPGPIMRVSEALREIATGQTIEVISTDPGFVSDIGPWCNSTGNRLVSVTPDDGKFRALIAKGQAVTSAAGSMPVSKGKTIVVFSSDFDKAVAAFVIANGAASMGSDVTMFFTFWGLNVLRKPEGARVSKNVIERMFGWMMPRGAGKLSLSKMNMAGMGLAMIKGIMRKKNVPSLPEFIDSARKAGVRMVACTMSMDLMGIKPDELIDGVEFGGVAMYLDRAESGCVNLFI